MLRLRIERPFRASAAQAAGREPLAAHDPASTPRLHLRIEHVNAGEVSQHSTLESGLAWLAARLSALVRSSSAPPDSGSGPSSGSGPDPTRRQSSP